MRFLRQQLDDPGAEDCGRCDNCGALSLDDTIAENALAAANSKLHRPGVAIEARRQWPTAMPGLGVDVKGKVAASDSANQGRAIARYTDLGYGPRVRATLAEAVPDGEVPADLVDAAVKVLAAWDWIQRPAAIVHVGSIRRPRLVADFAEQIGAIGRLPHLGLVTHLRQSSISRSNSAQRLRAVWGAYQVSADVEAALNGRHRGDPVLLVDDYTDTGWTLTVVARLLRQAGAGSVYPLVLGMKG
jgi:ATP-dependent DNA helicase RecQ